VRESIKCLLVVIAAAAVLIVLITPALDELPCTITKHTRHQSALVSVTAIVPFLISLSFPSAYRSEVVSQLWNIRDVLSANCILIC
jgi:hypothetical protein